MVEEISRLCNISCLKSDPEANIRRVVEEVPCIRSVSSSKTVTVLSSEDGEEDDAGYHQSEDESEEEEIPSSQKLSPGSVDRAMVGTPKKRLQRHRHRSPSPTSSEQDTDTESSSEDDSGENCAYKYHAHTRPQNSLHPSSPRQRHRLRPDGPERRNPEDSEDTVTDVTPLSTPDVSPYQSMNLALGPDGDREGEKKTKEQHKPQESIPPSPLRAAVPKEDSDQGEGDQAFQTVESRLASDLVISCPGGRNRKNYSFTNEEVRRIDRENQRLLHELSRPVPKSRPCSSVAGLVTTPTAHPIHLYHSALNRQREQQRIEKENLAFLRRLESVRPSRGIQRAEQLADYQRQARYSGTARPLHTIPRCSSKTDRSSSRTSPAKGLRPGSAPHHHGSRAASATSVASTTSSVPRSNKEGIPRAAWS